MNLKYSLVLLTLVSVVADTMLLPFYPHFFLQTFGNSSPENVGFYIAACCITVMVTFPLWAKLARYVHEFHIWIYSQIAACCLGIACYFSASLLEFWILSQAMLVFKASYLLIYPYVMKLEEKDKHLGMVGLFSVLMHFGAIGGALLGAFTLQFMQPKLLYLIMAATDLLQVCVCLYLIIHMKIKFKISERLIEKIDSKTDTPKILGPILTALGVSTMLFYFSVFLIRPFFTRYWELISESTWLSSSIATGFVYSIPGWIAVIGLWINHKRKNQNNNFSIIISSLLLGVIALLLQSSDYYWVVIFGRCIFGWSLFQVTVRLELLLFEVSSPERYGQDFSKIHFMQNMGVIFASFTVGSFVSNQPIQYLFYLAAIGLIITLLIFYWVFGQASKNNDNSQIQPSR
jgi:DHA1 family multidrug resistance protein-like MFS transporter